MADPNAAAAAAPIYVPAVSGVRSQVNTPAGVRLSNPNAAVRMDVDEIDLYTTPLQIIQPSGRTTGIYQSESLYNTKTTDGYFRLASTTAGYDGHIKIRREQEYDPFGILQVEESAYGFKPQHALRDDGRSLLPVDTPINEPIQYQEIRTDYDAFTFQIPALLEVCELLTPIFENPIVSTKTASGFGTRFAKGGLSTRIGQLRYACVMLYTFNSTIMDDPSTIVDPHKSTSYLEYIDKYIYNYEGRMGISVYPTMYHKIIAPFEPQIVYENAMIPDAIYDQIVNGLQQVMGDKSYTRLGAYVTCLLLPNLYLNSRYTEAMREFAYLLYNIAKALPIELRIGNNGSVTKFGPGHTKFYTSRGKAVLHPKQPLIYLDMEGKDLSQQEVVAEEEEEGVPDERDERRKERMEKIDRAAEAAAGKSKYYQLLAQLQERQRKEERKQQLLGIIGPTAKDRLKPVQRNVEDIQKQLSVMLSGELDVKMEEEDVLDKYMKDFIHATQITKGFRDEDKLGYGFLYQVDPDQYNRYKIASKYKTLAEFPSDLIDAIAKLKLDEIFTKDGILLEEKIDPADAEVMKKLKEHIGNDQQNISEFILFSEEAKASVQSVSYALSGIEESYVNFKREYPLGYSNPYDKDEEDAIQSLHDNYANILKALATKPKEVKLKGMFQEEDEFEVDVGMNAVAISEFLSTNPSAVSRLIQGVQNLQKGLVKYGSSMNEDVEGRRGGYMVSNKGETNIYMDPAVAEELMTKLVKSFEASSKAVQDEIGKLTEVLEKQNTDFEDFVTEQTNTYKKILGPYEVKGDDDDPEPDYDDDYATSQSGTIETMATDMEGKKARLEQLDDEIITAIGAAKADELAYHDELAPRLDVLNTMLNEADLPIMVWHSPYDNVDKKYSFDDDAADTLLVLYGGKVNDLKNVYTTGIAKYSQDVRDIKELIVKGQTERKQYIEKSNAAAQQKEQLEKNANMQLLQFIRQYQDAVAKGDMKSAVNLKGQYEQVTNQMQQNNIPISRNNARLMNDTAHAVQVMGDTIAGSVNKLGDIMIEYLKFLAADSIDQTIETLENIPAFDLLYVADAIEKKMLGDYQNSDRQEVQKYFSDFNTSLAYLTLNGEAFKLFRNELMTVYPDATEADVEQTIYQLLSRVNLNAVDYDSVINDGGNISNYELCLRNVMQTYADLIQFSDRGIHAINSDKLIDYFHEYSVITKIPFETLSKNSALVFWDSKNTFFQESKENPNFYRGPRTLGGAPTGLNVMFDKNNNLRSVIGMRPISKRVRKENESMLTQGVKGISTNTAVLNSQVNSVLEEIHTLYNNKGDGPSESKRKKRQVNQQVQFADQDKPFGMEVPDMNENAFQ